MRPRLRTVVRLEDALLRSGRFSQPGKKTLTDSVTVFTAVVVDVSEVPCERPEKAGRPYICPRPQRAGYRGNKKRHTLKWQLVADAGDQGIQHQHAHTRTPKKANKYHPLTDTQRHDNCRPAQVRLPIEHVIRRLKVFCSLKETRRHRQRRFNLRVNLIATLCDRIPIQT